MANARSFVAAIRDCPDDDTSRLVYADWLEDHGEPARAELIRVQCELARLPTYAPRYPELHLRQLEIVAGHEQEWLGEWTERLVRWEHRRGLLHSVTLTPQAFVTWGEELFADHPVERVALVDDEGRSLAEEEVARVVAAPAMGQVRALEVAGCRRGEPMCGMYGGVVATNAWLPALARAGHVTRLEELHLNGDTRSGRHPISLGAWRQFCQAGHLRTLRRLDLSDVYCNDRHESLIEVTGLLGGASFVRNLRALSFAHCFIGDEAARHLAAAPLVSLEDLDLARCDVLDAEEVAAVLSAPNLSRLKSLGLPCRAPLRAVAESPGLARLHALHLAGNSRGGSSVSVGAWRGHLGQRVADNEWEILFRSPHLQNLTRLSVGASTAIPAQAVSAFLQAPWSAGLRELRLSCENLSLEHLAPLFARPVEGPTPLHVLSLPDCTGVGEALAGWPGLAGITSLGLAQMYGQENAYDVTRLLRSGHLSHRLERLDLSGSCRTLANVRQLAGRQALAGLRWLRLGWNDLSPEKMKVLLRSPHLRHLESLHLPSLWDGETRALAELAAAPWPRLRDVVVGSGTQEEVLALLYQRFGPRLRVWADC